MVSGSACFVGNLPPRRLLSDIIHRCNIKLDSQLAISILLDVANGLLYLRKMGVQQRIITSEDVMVLSNDLISLICSFLKAGKQKFPKSH